MAQNCLSCQTQSPTQICIPCQYNPTKTISQQEIISKYKLSTPQITNAKLFHLIITNKNKQKALFILSEVETYIQTLLLIPTTPNKIIKAYQLQQKNKEKIQQQVNIRNNIKIIILDLTIKLNLSNIDINDHIDKLIYEYQDTQNEFGIACDIMKKLELLDKVTGERQLRITQLDKFINENIDLNYIEYAKSSEYYINYIENSTNMTFTKTKINIELKVNYKIIKDKRVIIINKLLTDKYEDKYSKLPQCIYTYSKYTTNHKSKIEDIWPEMQIIIDKQIAKDKRELEISKILLKNKIKINEVYHNRVYIDYVEKDKYDIKDVLPLIKIETEKQKRIKEFNNYIIKNQKLFEKQIDYKIYHVKFYKDYINGDITFNECIEILKIKYKLKNTNNLFKK
jgi:hypothetical protein